MKAKYKVLFPNPSLEKKFSRFLSKIPQKNIRDKIMEEVENLAANPYPFDKALFRRLQKKIPFSRFTAQYRLRIGDYRVLFDVDEKKRIVWILALRIRSEKIYR